MGGPRVWGRPLSSNPLVVACDHHNLGLSTPLVSFNVPKKLLSPIHREIRIRHFASGGQIEPHLKQFCGISFVSVEQREHFGVNNPTPCRHPLHIPFSKAGCGTQ